MNFLHSEVEWQNIRDYHERNRDVLEKWLVEEGHAKQTEAAICRAVLDNDPNSAIRFYAQRRCFELKNKKVKTFDEAVALQQLLDVVKRIARD